MKRSVFCLLLWLQLYGAASPVCAEQSLTAIPVTEPPRIDGMANDPAWQNAPVITTLDNTSGLPIRLQAVYTDTDIFFQVSFPDSDESRTHKSWVWDAGRKIYTVGDDREDIFIFKWNMEPDPADLSIYSGKAHRADVWFWKACRTDGAGYADDKMHIYSNKDDRHATELPANSGESMYLLRTGDAGESAYKIELKSLYQGNILPRYAVQQPTRSRGDVQARGVWQNGGWTIELGRKLITRNPDDLQLTPDKKYLFGVSRYEIAGRQPNAKLSDPLYGSGDVNETLWLEFKQ